MPAFLTACAITGTTPSRTDANPACIAVVNPPHQTYREVALTVQEALEKKHHTCVLIELPPEKKRPSKTAESKPDSESEAEAGDEATTSPASRPFETPEYQKTRDKLIEAKAAVIVALGTDATSFALEAVPGTPVVFCMVPNALDAPFMAKKHPDRGRLTGITTDIAPGLQIDWIVRLSPSAKTVGLLCSSRSEETAQSIQAAAQKKHIAVITIKARRDRFPEAVEALNARNCDSVLMIADASVYNSANVQALLLWGIRQQKPVWAFSDNVVIAGALAGLAADRDAIGAETAALVQKVIDGGDVSKLGLQYPVSVHSFLNERTAEMIRVRPSREVLQDVTRRFGKDQRGDHAKQEN